MSIRNAFSTIYIPMIVLMGELIHFQGKKILRHAFGDATVVSSAITMLLRFGWYITSLGLLLWNLGMKETEYELEHSDAPTRVALRLGIALFVLGVLHGANMLSVSLFHRKNNV